MKLVEWCPATIFTGGEGDAISKFKAGVTSHVKEYK